jgi:hypothetical protein
MSSSIRSSPSGAAPVSATSFPGAPNVSRNASWRSRRAGGSNGFWEDHVLLHQILALRRGACERDIVSGGPEPLAKCLVAESPRRRRE